MCDRVIIIRNGQRAECSSLGELRAALPGCVVIREVYPQPLPDDVCLCPVNICATAINANLPRVTPPFTAPDDEWAWVLRDA